MRDDAGKLHMLEAVLATLIMVSSVLTVVTLQRPGADPNALYAAHDRRLEKLDSLW